MVSTVRTSVTEFKPLWNFKGWTTPSSYKVHFRLDAPQFRLEVARQSRPSGHATLTSELPRHQREMINLNREIIQVPPDLDEDLSGRVVLFICLQPSLQPSDLVIGEYVASHYDRQKTL